MRIALYGGTFDPVHHGHLILAREAVEQLSLDRLIFVPASRSPFKPGIALTPADVRLAMVRAAIDGEEPFSIDDSEIARGGTSYTIDTVLAARARWAGAELWWLIGEDHVGELPNGIVQMNFGISFSSPFSPGGLRFHLSPTLSRVSGAGSISRPPIYERELRVGHPFVIWCQRPCAC
jgi:nicotinate-nucleotide adenylyltransferase